MRLGGSLVESYSDCEEWLALVRAYGYRCVTAPIDEKATDKEIEQYREAAQKGDVLIGEVGIWRNTLSPDPRERHEAIQYSIGRLKLADKLEANCCVNVAGARGDIWYGLYRENYLKETYHALVETIQLIIDEARPKKTFFTLEPMPWMVPDSPEQYLTLLEDVDRERFAVHLDFVNMINTPYKFAHSREFILSCFDRLAPYIKSIHVKDIRQVKGIPYSFAVEECPPGRGSLDYKPILERCHTLGEDTTVFMEHMSSREEYLRAMAYLKDEAYKAGVPL